MPVNKIKSRIILTDIGWLLSAKYFIPVTFKTQAKPGAENSARGKKNINTAATDARKRYRVWIRWIIMLILI